MLDYEINSLVQSKNFVITKDEYSEICKSPQVIYVKWNSYKNTFDIKTADGGYWSVKVI